MGQIYTAVYVCKSVTNVKFTGGVDYDFGGINDVVLGLQYGNDSTNVIIKGTLARFVKGKEYVINILEA